MSFDPQVVGSRPASGNDIFFKSSFNSFISFSNKSVNFHIFIMSIRYVILYLTRLILIIT